MSKALICERCGGTINLETNQCEYCGTKFKKAGQDVEEWIKQFYEDKKSELKSQLILAQLHTSQAMQSTCCDWRRSGWDVY